MHAYKNWQVVAILSAALCGLTGPRLVAEENMPFRLAYRQVKQELDGEA